MFDAIESQSRMEWGGLDTDEIFREAQTIN